MNLPFKRSFTIGALLIPGALLAQAPFQTMAPSPQSAESQVARPTNQNNAPRNVPSANNIPLQLQGGVPIGQRTDAVIPLSLPDAIQRGLKANLGIVSGTENVRFSRAERLRALNALVPSVTGRVTETEQQVNLAAYGFNFPGFPSIIGPFRVFDARAYLSQNVLNFSALANRRSAVSSLTAAEATFRDTRDQVVLAVVSLYLQAVTGQARVESAQAELQTAEALLRQAQDQKAAGVVAGIDVLRAQVERQSQQQRVIFYQAEAEKQKLNLGRAIGLPPGQQFSLVDRPTYTQQSVESAEMAIERAYRDRSDYRAAQAQVTAAEYSKRAAKAELLPSITLDANYGTIGQSLVSSHGTFTVGGGVEIPIFPGTRVRADIEEADSQLQQRRAERDSLRAQIDAEVRSAVLDLRAASEQVEVARSSLDLANEQLRQARDRFAAGVTNNIEVIQAQETVSTANENLISSLYQYNLAKASLIRATGGNDQEMKQALGGTSK